MTGFALLRYSFHFYSAAVSLAIGRHTPRRLQQKKNMSGTQKMFVCVSCMLIAGLVFTQAVPVPTPEEIHTAGNIFYCIL